MGDKWHTAKIGEIAEKVAMGPFGSSIKVSTFVDKGIPIISGQHLHGTRLEDSEFNFISYDHGDRLKNANVYRGDVVFTHAGNIEQVAYIPKDSKYERYVLSQRQFYIRCNLKKVLPEFVTYFFKTPDGQHKLLANTSQTGVPSIAQPVSYLKTIEILLPPLTEQKAIASILGALDDRIELNRKMNETLEAMARAIFKSWFVDFDPVPGIGSHKEWQDSPLGKIPKKWRVGKVSEAFEINPSRPIKKDLSYAYVDMASLPTTSARVTNVVLREFTGSGSKFTNGDVLFARITPCLENGKTALVDFLTEGEYGWGSTEFIVFSSKEPLNPWFVYCVARDQEFREHAIRAMSGTSGRQRVEIGCFNNFLIVIPPAEIVGKFGNIVSPWFRQMKMNDEQSATLTIIRDALLPKLLSGEIRVKDVERFVEAAS